MNVNDAEKVLRELIELVDGTLNLCAYLSSTQDITEVDKNRVRIISAWENIGKKFTNGTWWCEKCSDAIDMLFSSMHLNVVGYTRRHDSKLSTNTRSVVYYPDALAVQLEDCLGTIHYIEMPAPRYLEWDLLTNELIRTALMSKFAARAGAALHLMRIAEAGEYFSLRELLEADVPWAELSWEDNNAQKGSSQYNYWYFRARELHAGHVKEKLFSVFTKYFYGNVVTSRITLAKSQKKSSFQVNLVPDPRFGKTTFIV